MIRIRVSDYHKLRKEYLKYLAETGAAKFDKNDILDIGSGGDDGISQKTYEELEKLRGESPWIERIIGYLYDENKRIKRANLRGLLAGPEEEPYTFSGKGEKSLLSYFQEIIGRLGDCPDKDDVKKTIKNIFCYDKLKSGKGRELSYWLMRQIHQETCPYCNIGYTSMVVGKRKSHRAAFDHFFPKSNYPYLSLCLFNLVPACNTCNSLKSDDKRTVIYPYEESFDEGEMKCSFRLIPNAGHPEVFATDNYEFKIQFRFSGTEDYDNWFDIDFNIRKSSLKDKKKWSRIIESIDTFALEEVYTQCHKEEIRQFVNNYYVYNEAGVEMILGGIPKYAEDKTTIRNWLFFAFLNKDEWGTSPLNKLKWDLLEQLDTIKK